MSDVPISGRSSVVAPPDREEHGLGKTRRTDPWWIEWFSVAGGLLFLGIYAGWASFQQPLDEAHDSFKPFGTPYLSPFNSPEFLLWHHHPAFLPSGFVALLAILGFRGTCYYYRKAYYRAFFADPAGCAVGESRTNYCGETQLPFTIQNLHRYFMYLAIFALAFLWSDVIQSFNWFGRFGIGAGSIVMLINVCLLSGYTFGCHSIRHLVGGGSDCFSCSKGRAKAWSIVTIFNGKHQQWAWASLISVCVTDLYIRLVGLGVIHDIHFIS